MKQCKIFTVTRQNALFPQIQQSFYAVAVNQPINTDNNWVVVHEGCSIGECRIIAAAFVMIGYELVIEI